MEQIYGTIFLVGIVVVVLSLFVGELDGDMDGGFLLSPIAIASGFVAGGASGFAVSQWSDLVSVSFAIAAFIVAYAGMGILKSYLKKQSSNSHAGLDSYVGREAKIVSVFTDNRCVVAFLDGDGARIERVAINSHDALLYKNDRVVIHSIEDGELLIAPYDA